MPVPGGPHAPGLLPALIRIGKALLVALLILGAGEQAARLWTFEPPDRLYADDPVRVWSLRPGSNPDPATRLPVQVNSLGMRGPEPRDDDEIRVLLLGDSRIFGMFLKDEETLDRALEPLLRQATGRRVGVYNGGVPGYSSDQALEVLRDVGPRLRPDAVVFFDCLGDVVLATATDRSRLGPRPLRMTRRWLWNHSAAYRALSRWRRGGTSQQEVLFDRGSLERVPPEDLQRNLREMDRLSRSYGARETLIVRLPDQDCRPQNLSRNASRPAPQSNHHVRRLLDEGPRVTRFMDLWTRWAREGQPVDRLFFETRIHPRPEAVRILATQLAAELAPRLSKP